MITAERHNERERVRGLGSWEAGGLAGLAGLAKAGEGWRNAASCARLSRFARVGWHTSAYYRPLMALSPVPAHQYALDGWKSRRKRRPALHNANYTGSSFLRGRSRGAAHLDRLSARLSRSLTRGESRGIAPISTSVSSTWPIASRGS
jgi:hypothetical protein